MKPKVITVPATTRPNPVLVALAATWIILTLAFGGAVNADAADGAAAPAQTVTDAAGS